MNHDEPMNNQILIESAMESLEDPLTVIGGDFRVKWMNRAARELMLKETSLSDSVMCYTLQHRRDTPCEENEYPCPLKKLRTSQEPVRTFHEHTVSGTKRIFEITATPLLSSDGTFQGIVEIERDVTERIRLEEDLKKYQQHLEEMVKERTLKLSGAVDTLKKEITQRSRAEKALAKSENKYRTIFETTGTATVLIEDDMTISRVNTEFENLSGYPKQQIEGKKRFTDFFAQDSLDTMKEYHILRREAPDAAPRNYECNMIERKGNIKTLLATVSIVPGTKESVASFLDITDRKQAEKIQLKLLKEIQTIFENLPLGIAYLDNEFKFISTNRFFNEFTGYKEEDIIGKTCYETVGEHAGDVLKKGMEKICSFCKKDECFKNLKPTVIERPLRDKFMRVTTVPELDEEGNIYRFIEMIEDITGRKQAEEKARLQQQQLMMLDKMKSLGILVSGVAHEINNPNNYILLNAKIVSRVWNDITPIIDTYYRTHGDFALSGMPYSKAGEKINQLISGITDGAVRIQKIVQGLKDFARQDKDDVTQETDANSVLKSSLLIMDSLIRKSTRKFSVRYGKNLPFIRVNIQQLEQVLINLITNACHALTDKENGITVSTSYKKNIDRLILKIRDGGAGISADDLRHIFDPFFTTKHDVDGTGLGLSISYNIVKRHGGELKFESKPGKGTIASVILPVVHTNHADRGIKE